MRLLLGLSALAATALSANPYNYYQQEQGSYYNYPDQYVESFDYQGYGYDQDFDHQGNQNVFGQQQHRQIQQNQQQGYFNNQGYSNNPHGNQQQAQGTHPDIRIEVQDRPAVDNNNQRTTDRNSNGHEKESTWGSWFGGDKSEKTDAHDRANSSVDHSANGNVVNGVDNNEVVRRIRVAVASDNGLSSNAKRVLVTSVNGEVTLSGVVDNSAEKDKVESIVNNIDGVKSVKNNIRVRNNQ